MMKIDSIESVSISTNKKGRGRLVRSLEFTNTTKSKSKSTSNHQTKTQAINSSIWRDPVKNVIPHSTGFTAHKMSSVTNNFMSSDDLDDVIGNEIETSEIEEIVEDLDPGRGALVFLQHDEVFRTSPLSSSNSFEYPENDNDNDNENEIDSISFDNYPVASTSTSTSTSTNGNGNGIILSNTDSSNTGEIGMSWNPKQNRWIPLIYRYVFPSSAFSVATKSLRNSNDDTTWSLQTGKNHYNSSSSRSYSFKFPPPQKSIMMGPNGLLINSEMEAREACEQLLDLIDDKNLALPLQNSQYNNNFVDDKNNNICPRACASNTKPLNSSTTSNPIATGRSILSEWSSLPSSPPPPIFHDVCNRPIPELRLSPPMTGKSIGKRLFQTANSTNSPCESPLTKRLRFSSSSSSIS